jgi:hypothetical protein
MNDDSTPIPSHRPSIPQKQIVVNPALAFLRPHIKDEDILWIENTYKYNVKTATSEATLHCLHWARIVHAKLNYVQDNVILQATNHTVCRVEGFYIDIFNNAILSGFNWEFEGFKEDSSYTQIDFTGRDTSFITEKYYDKPALKIVKYRQTGIEFVVRQEDMEWMSKVYESIIQPNRGLKLLTCTAWDTILYHKFCYIVNREIQTNNKHTVLVAHKVYIDLECNAYLYNFDWKTQVWNENIRVIPINKRFIVRYDLLQSFYAEKALKTTTYSTHNEELS